MPNTGKSTFFTRLTGAHAQIGNWPGLTVDLLQAQLELGGRLARVVDLPGIYDLRGYSEDELLVRGFLERTPLDLVLVILNASQIDRQLQLVLQAQSLGLPVLLLLNMADEARRFGLTIDHDVLSSELGLTVLPISAKYGTGFAEVRAAIEARLALAEAPVRCLDPARFLLADPALDAALAPLLEAAVRLPDRLKDRTTRRLDALLLHPVLGLPLFFGVMFLMFQGIYALGVPLQAGLATVLNGLGAQLLRPLLGGLPPF